MTLTRAFKDTIKARVARDPNFRRCLLHEAMSCLLGGDVPTGKALLRDYINATVGFEQLAARVNTPAKSLHRMLGPKGNPRADNLFRILATLRASEPAMASGGMVQEAPAVYAAGRRGKRKRPAAGRVREQEARGSTRRPRCFVIAGPNGAGKTTFAREYLPREAGTVHFVNADLIAGGLSPLEPGLAAVASARLVLAELDRLAAAREDFAFESTLSGLAYLARLRRWKQSGYFVKVVFLRLDSPELALKRIAERVRQGGHDVPRADVMRRFSRSVANFDALYRPLADAWELYDNSQGQPRLLEAGP